MKKFVLFLMIAAVSVAGVSCTRPLAVSMAAQPEQVSAVQAAINDFTKKTGIKVILNSVQGTMPQAMSNIASSLDSQSSPDVVLVNMEWIQSLAASGLLKPFEKAGTADFFQNVLAADTREGKLVALPVTMDAGVVFYRKDAAEGYGLTKLPLTYQEVAAYSRDMNKKIKNAGRGAMLNSAYYAFQGSVTEQTVCNFIEAALSNGGGIKLEDGKFIINTPQNKKALETLKGLITSKVSSSKNYELGKDEYIRAFFQQGSAFAIRGWASDISFHNSSVSLLKGKAGVYEVPALVKGKSSPVAGGLHVAVGAKSVSAQNAFKLADFLVSRDAQKKMALNGGITPARKDLYSDTEIISLRPEYAALPAVFSKASLRPVDPRYPKASEIMQKYISAALFGAYSAAEALEKCQADLDGI